MQKDMHCWNCTRFILLSNMEEAGWLSKKDMFSAKLKMKLQLP